MNGRRSRITALAAALLAAAAGSTLAALAPPRIVAVGDIHGAHDDLLAILREVGIVDAGGRWMGGDAVLVQTGDMLDRGDRGRDVLELLMRLEVEARAQGGRVEVLLGNHEVMNLIGDLRYVSTGDYASFAGTDSERRREEAWQAHVARQGRLVSTGAAEPEPTREEWLATRPPGFVERAQAFAPDGRYGAWLRRRPAILEIDGTVFLHGGISPETVEPSVGAFARTVRDEIASFDTFRAHMARRGLALPHDTLPELVAVVRAELMRFEIAATAARAEGREPPPLAAQERLHLDQLVAFAGHRAWLGVSSRGLLWFRGFSEWSEEEGTPEVTRALASLGARRFVTGHTPDPDGEIASRFGGRVFVIDTGMLASHYPGGCATALQIDGDAVTAIDLRGRRRLTPDAAAPRSASFLDPDGRPLPLAGADEVLDFLRSAQVVSTRDVGEGITRPKKVLLERRGVRANAVFRHLNREEMSVQLARSGRQIKFRDTFLFELAAYELDRLLGLDRVPPVVRRSVERRDGALQIWIERAMTETARREKKVAPPDPARWSEDMQVMAVWDNLVENTDRNSGNYLLGEDGRVWFIDHTRAFRRSHDLPTPEGLVRLPRWLWQRLKDLDPAAARDRLRPYLREDEIVALLARRDGLLEHFDRHIRERGEDNVLDAGAGR